LDEAHVIIFLVSYKDGVDANDQYVAKILRKYKSKNIIVVANKAENKTFEGEQVFYQLGFGKPLCVSAEHGIGIGDLLDAVIKKMSNFETKVEAQDHVKFCIIGRTNVGKSTLMNAVLGKERTVVSSIEHTTRDSINEDFYRQKELYTIIDTAGIRRKGHVTDQIEKYAVLRTQIAIEESNLILFVIDVSEPFNEQDEVIGGLA
jgi:GTP-binding protein